MTENVDCGNSLQMEFEAEATYKGTFEGNALSKWYYDVLPDMEAAVKADMDSYTVNCLPKTGCDECTKLSDDLDGSSLDIVPDKNDPTKGTVTVTVRKYNITNCACKGKPSKGLQPKKKKVDWKKWLLTPEGEAYRKLKEKKLKFKREHIHITPAQD